MDKLTNHIGKKIIDVTCAKDLGELCGITLENGVITFFVTTKNHYVASGDILGKDSYIATSGSKDNIERATALPPIGANAVLNNGKNLGVILDYEFARDYRLTRVLCQEANLSASRILSFSDNFIVFAKASCATQKSQKANIEEGENIVPKDTFGQIPTIISDYSFLIGRQITRDIFLPSGRRLFCANSTISLDSVNIAKLNNKLVELTLYSARKVS